MAAEIVGFSDGIVTASISGKLAQSELTAVQKAVAQKMKEHGKVRLLILAQGFDGWGQGSNWGDLSFQMEHDHNIEKMAIVSERKWEELVLVFTAKGLRSFPIEFFDSADLEKARQWIASA